MTAESIDSKSNLWPSVSVIIPTLNDAGTIELCLKTLVAQRYPDFETIIVNDGSTDETPDIIRKFIEWMGNIPFQVIDLPENRGISAARNLAMKKATGEIFVFTDADCYFEKHWLINLVSPLRKKEAGCSGGPDQVPSDATLIAKCIDYSMHSLIASGELRRGRTRLAKYSPAGCNMAVKRKVIEKIGNFDESLRFRGEEKELEHRIRKAGYRIEYVEKARVWHHRRATLGLFWRQTFASGKARIDILQRAPGALEFAHLFPALLVGVLAAVGIVSFFNPLFRTILAGILAGYLSLLILDGILGTFKLRDYRALFIIPITSAIVHFAYGLGTVLRLFHK